MQHSFFLRITFPALAVVLLLSAGCAFTERARFYTLSPLAGPQLDTSAGAAGQGIAIGIDSVRFPDYLKGPQIVTRTSRNELDLAEFDRWAGSLDKDFARILAENLSNLLPTHRVFSYPWRRSVPIDYRVSVEVLQFDAKAGESVSLVARWNISGADGEEVFLMKKSSFTVPTTHESYDAIVAAESQALADLSHAIAADIKDVSKIWSRSKAVGSPNPAAKSARAHHSEAYKARYISDA